MQIDEILKLVALSLDDENNEIATVDEWAEVIRVDEIEVGEIILETVMRLEVDDERNVIDARQVGEKTIDNLDELEFVECDEVDDELEYIDLELDAMVDDVQDVMPQTIDDDEVEVDAVDVNDL